MGDASLSKEEKSTLLYKFGLVRQLIGKFNVAIWSEINQRMYFSFPASFVEKDANNNDNNNNNVPTIATATNIHSPNNNATTTVDELSHYIASVALDPTLVATNEFRFVNSTWDLLEEEVEHGTFQHAGEQVTYAEALEWILKITREDGHKLYTTLSLSEWDYMLHSPDSYEAIKSIKDSILENVERAAAAAATTVTQH